MMVWYCGAYRSIKVGQQVFVGHCGSGHTVFGEMGKLEKATTQHLVFRTESGETIKTKIDNLHDVIGKAGMQGNFVSLNLRKENEYIHSPLFVY